VHVGDGRLFVKQAKTKYDVVIVDLPGPENAQLNRFYSLGFFQEVRSILRPKGVFFFSLVGAENYLEEKGLAINRSVHEALKQVFDTVLVLPGTTHYYLASDGPLTAQITPIMTERAITTKQLVDYELPSLSDPFRLELLRKVLNQGGAVPNEDLSPIAFGHLMDMWLKKSGSSKTLVFILLILAVGFAGFTCRKNRVQFTIMTSGYAGMAFELSLLLLFQVIYGYVYLRICLFVTLFMIGSALGAFIAKKAIKKPDSALIATDLALVILSLAASFAALSGVGWRSQAALFVLQYAFLPALLFMGAFAVGYQFTAASNVISGSGSEVLGRLYLADLAGAACGTILTGLVFVPKIGIVGVLLSVAVIKTLSMGLSLSRRGDRPS